MERLAQLLAPIACGRELDASLVQREDPVPVDVDIAAGVTAKDQPVLHLDGGLGRRSDADDPGHEVHALQILHRDHGGLAIEHPSRGCSGSHGRAHRHQAHVGWDRDPRTGDNRAESNGLHLRGVSPGSDRRVLRSLGLGRTGPRHELLRVREASRLLVNRTRRSTRLDELVWIGQRQRKGALARWRAGGVLEPRVNVCGLADQPLATLLIDGATTHLEGVVQDPRLPRRGLRAHVRGGGLGPHVGLVQRRLAPLLGQGSSGVSGWGRGGGRRGGGRRRAGRRRAGRRRAGRRRGGRRGDGRLGASKERLLG